MQINHYTERYKKSLEWTVKIIVTGLCIYFISTRVDLSDINLKEAFDKPDGIIIYMIVLMLMPLNWALEAEKWRVSIPHETSSFQEAWRRVLAGLALNWVIPFTLGDVGGRLLNVQNAKKSAGALLINRTILLLITLLYGGIAVLYYFDWYNHWMLAVPFLVVGVGLAALSSWGNGSMWIQVLALSLLRYAIFTFQFYLVLSLFLPELAWYLILLGIGWIFLFRSVIPSFLGNFGVREASAIVFFQAYVPDVSIVLIPCLIIWMINTVIPSILGTVYVFKLKLNIAQ